MTAVSIDLLEALGRAKLAPTEQLEVIRCLLQVRAERRAARRAEATGISGPANGDTATVSVPVSDPRNGDKVQTPVPVSPVPLGPKHAARKALLMAPGLTLQDRAVLAAMVDRADPETGRCWPSRRRLALDAGIAGRQPERAVLRAIHAAERDGLIARSVRGGGRGRATIYIVNWTAFSTLLQQCEGRAEGPRMAAALGRLGGRNEDTGNGDKRRNGDNGVPPTQIQEITSLPPERQQRWAQGKRPTGGDRRQGTLLMPIAGGRGAAAYGRAGQRLWDDICRHGDVAVRRRLLDLVGRDEGLSDRATLAEMRVPGSGLGVLLIASAHGPPVEAAG